MRLRRLDLDFFGHFTGRSFDFGERTATASDFHIVYGPNEAGKTTTMEGYLRLLYGFDMRESYAFMHERKALKVSGILDVDGVETAYTRLPVRNASLVDAVGNPVPQAALDRVLAGLGQEEYRKLLCLDDDTIEQGGKEIIDSKGDIGLLLFGASAGISDLSAVLAQVNEDARDLYLKGGGKSRYAVLRRELDEINARIKQIDVTTTAYGALRNTLVTATAAETEADAGRRALLSSAARLTAMAEALPLLGIIDGRRERLATLAHYPERLDIDPEALVTMLGEQRARDAERASLANEIATLRETLAAIDCDPDRLTFAEELEMLQDSKAEYRAAQKHLPNRIASHEDALRRMRRCADDLGAGQDVDPATLALSPAQLAALDDGRTRLAQARRDTIRLRDDRDALAERVAGSEDALDRLTTNEPDGQGIAPLLDRFDRAAHDVAVQRIADAEIRVRSALTAISIKGTNFDIAPTAPVTAAEAGEMVERLSALDRTREEQVERMEALNAEGTRLAARIKALSNRAGIIDDAAVQAALEARGTLWSAHREVLSKDTADRFETAMMDVDDMADRRLGQAEDLGALRALEAERVDCVIQRDHAVTTLARIEAAIADARAPLDAAIAAIPVSLTPTQGGLVAWLRNLETVQVEVRSLDEASRIAEPILAKVDALAADLTRVMPDSRETDTFADLLDMAQAMAEGAREHTAAIERARTEFETLRDTGSRGDRLLASAEGAEREAMTEWANLVTERCGATVSPDTLFASLDPLRNLRDINDERLDLTGRIDKMKNEQARFHNTVIDLAEGQPVPVDDDPLDIFAALERIADLARKAEDRWQEANERLDAKLLAQETAEQALAQIAAQIEHLGATFDPSIATNTLDALRESVGIAYDTIAERRMLDEEESRVRTLLGVADMDEARTIFDERSADDIAAERTAIDTDIALADARYREAIGTRRDAERAIDAVTGDDDVARLMERRRTLELDMQEVALDYLELRLGNTLAEEAIRRYRDANRSAMLHATETAFAELTNGAYTRLTTLPDGQSETLLAIDGAGTTKAADAMSKGTRFQLFLALRAAAYEQMAANGAALPFFCDDIFETFDEDRTRAACTLMARIGRTGQAIYLTHHRHVVDIAQDVCGKDLTVHTI